MGERWPSRRVVTSCNDSSNVGLFHSSRVAGVSVLCDYFLGQCLQLRGAWAGVSSRSGKFSYARAVSSQEPNKHLPLGHLHPVSTALAFLVIIEGGY